MKSDIEVLDGAIAIMERDGGWCQGRYYTEDADGDQLSYCAEGAIHQAAGFWEFAYTTFDGNSWEWNQNIDLREAKKIMQQCVDLINCVAKDLGKSISILNDASDTTAGDMILVLKRYREKIA